MPRNPTPEGDSQLGTDGATPWMMSPFSTHVALALLLAALPVTACGGAPADPPDAPGTDPDAAAPDAHVCITPGATSPFTRRGDNPRLRAGTSFDGLVDVTISDPDVHWDPATDGWRAYFMAARGESFAGPLTQTIREVRGSADGATWTLVDPPALTASASPAAWDHVNTETPTVVFNPDAPAERRYLLLYSGASEIAPGQSFPAYAIGAAFSADGVRFTRVAAGESPHGEAGLVLTGADVYPDADEALVADPEVLYHDGVYHLWFSSYGCTTTTTACDSFAAFGVAHATSTDGVHWTPDAVSPVPGLLRDPGSPSSGGMQPSVVWDDVHCQYELWLTSDGPGENDAQPIEFNNTMGVWRATSDDGDAWTIDYQGERDLAWDPAAPGEPLGMLTGNDGAVRGEQRLMLYVGFDDQQVPDGFFLPDRTPTGYRPGVMALGVATRD